MLEIHLSLSIKWHKQFKVIIEKMKSTIDKLRRTTIHPHLTYIMFNAYMMKSVYFRCGIVELNPRQEKLLQKEYEEMILTKLGLSKKFP